MTRYFRCACDNPDEIYYHEKCIKKASADQSAVTESNAESPFEELGQCHVDTCDGRPLKYGISYAKCCCELGNKWTTGDDQCSMCPQRTSPQWNDLCELEVVDFNVSYPRSSVNYTVLSEGIRLQSKHIKTKKTT